MNTNQEFCTRCTHHNQLAKDCFINTHHPRIRNNLETHVRSNTCLKFNGDSHEPIQPENTTCSSVDERKSQSKLLNTKCTSPIQMRLNLELLLSTGTKKSKWNAGINNAPCILEITGYEGIFIHKNPPYPIEIDSFEDMNMNWKRDKIRIDKLKVINKGDWEITISMVNTKYFKNRDMLDHILLANNRLSSKKEPRQNIKRISIQKALDYINTKLWINMEYYMKNRNELEADLMRKVSDTELNDEHICKRIEQELFYRQMLKIFGSDEKASSDDIF
ncbi:unnamed protein product [Brachionus calyciflorus]|uniref:Uncharacterized protein n=1 Tax=Brachionus calyciflorus TaxID=104777 RepID=A0A814JAY7_9BILA|nr:unnamed protein product [Brachionus calyciflorus]